ncbi:MAG: DUF3108 domain-containing protein [Gemmatimonadales bacterium]|jgi:hypothetical protein|nr:DUF3108 domain-containing protein [Gemmatimonadales bacterium]
MLALLAALAAAPLPPDTTALPFAPGERLDFSVEFGGLDLGSAFMEVVGPDVIRGHATVRLRMGVRLAALGFAADDTLDSWLDRDQLVSRRFHRRQHQTGRHRDQRFEIDPENRRYTRHDSDAEYLSAADPLDDVSFLYVVRTLPLEAGRTYRWSRYFEPEKNPVTVEVLGRESLRLPDGSEVACLVLAPVVGTRGLFAPTSRARLWLTDDARRLPVQIAGRFGPGEGTLRLRRLRPAGAAG